VAAVVVVEVSLPTGKLLCDIYVYMLYVVQFIPIIICIYLSLLY